MANETYSEEFETLNQIINALQKVEPAARPRLLQTVATFFNIEPPIASQSSKTATKPGGFSEDRSMSPKEFLHEKQPKTDVERITCLAYYLTHYRATPYFKTLDLSQLNTEAAQIKFSNPAWTVNDAVKKGFLVPAAQGQRQISSVGEQFVLALPDRDAAKQALAKIKRRKKSKKSGANLDEREPNVDANDLL